MNKKQDKSELYASFTIIRTGKRYRLVNFGETFEFEIIEILSDDDAQVRSIDTLETYHLADLFRYLLPPGAQLIEYGGSRKGDKVHLKLPVAGAWISEIIENGASADTCYFIDEGRTLPFPLKEWRHKHILHRAGNSTIIEDNINFISIVRIFEKFQ